MMRERPKRVHIVAAILISALLICPSARAANIPGLVINSLEIYADKSKIPDIGTDGWGIPSGAKVAVLRTTGAYTHWKFVAYGDTLSEILSIWEAAKIAGMLVSCTYEDRGNYWVQCVGTSIQ
jgi:hypothetical protein